MTLREIEVQLSLLCVAVHDLARESADPTVAERLRELADSVCAAAGAAKVLTVALAFYSSRV